MLACWEQLCRTTRNRQTSVLLELDIWIISPKTKSKLATTEQTGREHRKGIKNITLVDKKVSKSRDFLYLLYPYQEG